MALESTRTETASHILAAAKEALLEVGYASLSTRAIAERAGVPLSQIHYHYGSKQNLVLAVLEGENARLIERQEALFDSDFPLWKKWQLACDYLEADLDSGYVRVLHEMIAAGWANADIAAAVTKQLGRWQQLLTGVARRAETKLGSLGPFTPEEIGVLAGIPFIGAEAYLLLGVSESAFPARSALRKIGDIIRAMEGDG
ncbi:MAG: TetR/AcrR family transcriptional regulator [Acidimicrobiia bacterium]|nr:TetR/AcrR family transcriptional regulator [Acidimicrobiia bacterium]